MKFSVHSIEFEILNEVWCIYQVFIGKIEQYGFDVFSTQSFVWLQTAVGR